MRGDLRTYKIHLGSGNILMSPNNQYLCIVPGQTPQASTGSLFLDRVGEVSSVVGDEPVCADRDGGGQVGSVGRAEPVGAAQRGSQLGGGAVQWMQVETGQEGGQGLDLVGTPVP